MTHNPEQSERLLALAAKLTTGAQKALLLMDGEFKFGGAGTFNANGAWALHWLRGVRRGELAEIQRMGRGKSFRYAYRLTPLGIALRDYIRARAGDGA